MRARPVLCPSVVGRDEELRVIDEALECAQSGRGGTLVLVGEAGVGKSRLARETGTRAEQQRVRVVWGRCVEGGQASPYRPLAEALLGGLRGRALPDVPELRPFQPVLGRLIPGWRTEAGPLLDASVVPLGEGILRLLIALGGGAGCVLILEDLHWADPETLSLFEYLSANVAAEPLLLLATLRSGEPAPALGLASSLSARRLAHLLELPRLSTAEIDRMAVTCLGISELPRPVAAALAASAEGLPLLVEDLLAEWLASGQLALVGEQWQVQHDLAEVVPVTFADTVRRRLDALGSEAAELLRLAALLGRRFDWRVLAGATSLPEERILEALQQAVQRQLISSEPTRHQAAFRFRHALTQAAVLADLLPPQRARLAGRLLDSLQTAHPGVPGEWCDLAARLAEEVGDPDRAAALLHQSGRQALERGALTTAEATLQHARELCQPGGRLAIALTEALVDVLALAGKHTQVRDAGGHLLEALARQGGPPERLAQAHLRLARAEVAASSWAAASQHLALARELAAGAGSLTASVDALAAHVAIGQGQLEQARELAGRALTCAESVGHWEVSCEALEVLGRTARERDLHEAEAAFDHARRLAEAHGLTIWRLRALHELGTLDLFTPGAGPRRLTEARALAEQSGALGLAAMLDVQLAAMYTALGEFDAVLELTSRSASMAQRLGLNLTRGAALLFQAEVYARRGPDRAAMEASLRAALAAADGDALFEAEAQAAAWADSRAMASLVEENRPRALREVDTAQDYFRVAHGGAPSPGRGLWVLLSTLVDSARGAQACREVASSDAMVHPINQAFVRYSQAMLAGRADTSEVAHRAMVDGDALLAVSCPWYQHLARRLVAEEAIARGWGEPARWLREAAPFFDQHGQPRLASACRSLLRKLGAPARAARAHPTVPPGFRSHGVTTREMEVLSVIGEGLSNREIGARLYLSPKTVEKHIASLMDKLDVRTRAQLAAIAASGSVPA